MYFLIAVTPATLKPIDDPTLFEDWIFILGGHQEAFDGFTSFEIYLYARFVTGLFEALTHTLMIVILRKLTAVSKSLSLSKN